jgi:hypothetical protein
VSQRSPAPTVGLVICGRRVVAPTVDEGHWAVRCAPDSARCANGPVAATVDFARFGRKSRTGQATVVVRCSTRQKARIAFLVGLQRLHRTKYSLSILRLSHSASTHLIDCVSDLSSVRAVNSLCYVSSSSLGLCACVCYGFVCCVCCSPSLTLVPSL